MLPGGELLVSEQDEVIEMLEKLRDYKQYACCDYFQQALVTIPFLCAGNSYPSLQVVLCHHQQHLLAENRRSKWTQRHPLRWRNRDGWLRWLRSSEYWTLYCYPKVLCYISRPRNTGHPIRHWFPLKHVGPYRVLSHLRWPPLYHSYLGGDTIPTKAGPLFLLPF